MLKMTKVVFLTGMLLATWTALASARNLPGTEIEFWQGPMSEFSAFDIDLSSGLSREEFTRAADPRLEDRSFDEFDLDLNEEADPAGWKRCWWKETDGGASPYVSRFSLFSAIHDAREMVRWRAGGMAGLAAFHRLGTNGPLKEVSAYNHGSIPWSNIKQHKAELITSGWRRRVRLGSAQNRHSMGMTALMRMHKG